MLLYVSPSKINNLYNEMLLKDGLQHYRLSEIKIKTGIVDGKIDAYTENTLVKLHTIIQHSRIKKSYKIISQTTKAFQCGTLYECNGIMHWQKTRPTNIGVIITHAGLNDPSGTLPFLIDLDNNKYSTLAVVCSIKNLEFMQFVDQDILKPNSLGELLISAQKSISVKVIFELVSVDEGRRVLVGAPLVVYTS